MAIGAFSRLGQWGRLWGIGLFLRNYSRWNKRNKWNLLPDETAQLVVHLVQPGAEHIDNLILDLDDQPVRQLVYQ